MPLVKYKKIQNTNVNKVLSKLNKSKEGYFSKRGNIMAFSLFKEMSKRVPAYKKFLKKNNFDPNTVKSIKDFSKIPTIDKDNYLKEYPREELCWDGDFRHNSWVISTTSGSTGEPFYFPRQDEQDEQYAFTAELYLLNNFNIDKKSTLYIVAFPMGAWIGGVFTYEAIKTVAESGKYNLSIITPGISKVEVIKAVKNLGKDFDQIIIGSYGPFLKDIIDDASTYGVDWVDYDVKFVMSAEAISEGFRDYLQNKTGFKNIFLDTLNHYGTVDMGTMAHETPLAILVRRLAVGDKDIFRSIFGDIGKTPTLAQFIPEMFYFESDNGRLYCSAYSGVPLVRYDLKDNGDVFTLDSLVKKLKDKGLDLNKLIEKEKLKPYIWNLPFVHVFERNDFSVSFFAFQIYPETIKKAFLNDKIQEFATGKFCMEVNYNNDGRQIFNIHTELRRNMVKEKSMGDIINKEVLAHLLSDNSEFRKTYEMYGDEISPNIIFWEYEDDKYFKVGGKQKWVTKC
jgi:phenylacetate-CoA ligase